jgi:hypothetical protein
LWGRAGEPKKKIEQISRLFTLRFLQALAMNLISVKKDINYCSAPLPSRDAERELDIYDSSNSNENLPVLLFVHGGAWRTGDKSEHVQLAEGLAQKGFTVAVNNYRFGHFSMKFTLYFETIVNKLPDLVINQQTMGDLSFNIQRIFVTPWMP